MTIKPKSIILPHGKLSFQASGKSFYGPKSYGQSVEVFYGAGVVLKNTPKAMFVKFMHEENPVWIPNKAIKSAVENPDKTIDVTFQFWFVKMIEVSTLPRINNGADNLKPFIEQAKSFDVDSYMASPKRKLNHIVDIHKLDWDPVAMVFSTTAEELKSAGHEPLVFDGDYKKWIGKKIYDLYNKNTKKNIRFIENVTRVDKDGKIIEETFKPYFKRGSDAAAVEKLKNIELIIFYE